VTNIAPKIRSFRIGEVASRSGVAIETLRFYEKSGLIEPAGRTESGYRLYDGGIFERLSFIKKAQSVGFRLEEIARIIDESTAGKRPCKDVRRLAAEKLAELEQRIKELQRYRRELRETLAAWEHEGERDGYICGLIEGLEADKPRRPRKEGK
jgi:MerR family Zn(II)-responsive transcriptional regulator of zntA